MKPWSVDAREAIQDTNKIKHCLIEETEEIKDFLYEDSYYFIVATKGLGKSLLLLTKRKLLNDIGSFNILPKNTLLDVPKFSIINLTSSSISMLSAPDTMELLKVSQYANMNLMQLTKIILKKS